MPIMPPEYGYRITRPDGTVAELRIRHGIVVSADAGLQGLIGKQAHTISIIGRRKKWRKEQIA